MRTRLTFVVLLTAALVLGLTGIASAKHAKRYKDDVFKKVKITRDLYQPKGDTATKRPVVIFAHGGGFTGGDKSSGPSATLAKEFALKGYLTASINYRLDGPSTGCTGA